jgi:hypothetical protein
MLSLLLASTIAHAAVLTMNCQIVETNTKSVTTNITHTATEDEGHAMTPFKTELVHGFVATSHGYGVINIIDNKTEQVVSFHGDITHGGIVGGKIMLAGTTTWVEADCQLVK